MGCKFCKNNMFWCKLYKNYFHRLEVVGRGSETQLQVGENAIYLTQRLKG